MQFAIGVFGWLCLFFSISLIDFVWFCKSRTFFCNEKMQLFKIYASRGGSCVGNSPPTTPDQIEGDHKQCCPPCSKSIGPFLVRTASQSQRGGVWSAWRVLRGIDPRLVPVVPHKAVARGWLSWITDGRANPLMDRKVVGVVFFGVVAMVAVVNLLTTAGCSMV